MDCPAFIGLDLRTSTIIIAVVGMLHWVACAVPARRFRSELFVVVYVLSAAAGLVSCLLLLAVLTSMIELYWVWTVFTFVYVAVMVAALLVMLVGFHTLRMRGAALMPLLALLYYILTLYFICVVNSHRCEVLRARWVVAGVGRPGAGASNASSSADVLRDPTATAAVTTPNYAVARRGRCAVPSENPPEGAYHGVLPNQQFARRDRGYHRLRVWVACSQHHRPRHLPYALCYSGGWNLPLPDCVRDKSFYEVYYYHDDYEYEETTEAAAAAPAGACAVPRPPAHGYFTRELAAATATLLVRCNALHFLVGWQRLTCLDGHWNRPVPKCLFMDITVCTLLKRTDGMMRTCLASEHYAGTYRCDSGVVPHGTAVEPRCRRDRFVWGPFRYMHCIDGEWHPRDVTWHNITCQHATDIYRHYEIEERKTSTTPGEHIRIGDNATATNAADAFSVSVQDDDDSAAISPHMEEFLTRNFTKMSIWKRKNKTVQSSTKIDIAHIASKAQNKHKQISHSDVISNNTGVTGQLPKGAGQPLSSKSANKKLRNPLIDDAQGESLINSTKNEILQSHRKANESLDENSIRTHFWKLQKDALKANTAKTQSFINFIKNDSLQSYRQAKESLDDDSIRTNFWKIQKQALKADAIKNRSATDSFINSIENDILQSHRQTNESLDDDSIRTDFWKMQKEALKANAISTKSVKHESFINSIKNYILQSHSKANEPLGDDSIRTNFFKLQKEALKADATGIKSTNKKLRHPQIEKAQSELLIDSSESEISQSYYSHTNESLNGDSIRTNFWIQKKEPGDIDTSLWKTQKHAGASIKKANTTKIRNIRNKIEEKPMAKTKIIYLWTSQTEDYSELRAKTNQISIWKSESVNKSEMMKAKSDKISIWKPQSQIRGSSSTSSNELSIWKSQNEDFGKQFSVKTSKKNKIWKTEKATNESLGMAWAQNNISKSREHSDNLVHPNLGKIKKKRFRKKASKWLGMHSGRPRGDQ